MRFGECAEGQYGCVGKGITLSEEVKRSRMNERFGAEVIPGGQKGKG